MEYYFYLANGRTHTFKNYSDAKRFYEKNTVNIIDTNFDYILLLEAGK